jgi:Ribonuclease HepT-like
VVRIANVVSGGNSVVGGLNRKRASMPGLAVAAHRSRHRRSGGSTSIAGLRNVAIHEYCKINPDLIGEVVDNELATMAESLRDRSAGTE